MVDFQSLLTLQLQMFLLMGLGMFLRYHNMITKEGKRVITDLVINIILPCNIINSFCITFNQELLRSGLQILFISIAIQLMCTLIASTCFRSIPKGKRMVLQYGTVCSNAGFLGNPIAEGLYGSEGLLFASIYLIPQRIVMWSAGVSYFTESPNRKEVIKKVLKHPCIIAVEIGMVLMLTQFQMPLFLSKTIKSLANCNTAMSMIVIGTILGDSGLARVANKITLFYSAIRLIVIPFIVMIVCRLAGLDAMASSLSVVLAAMPAGGTTAILAAKYHGDEAFASQCVVLSTFLSMLALPVWCMILGKMF